MAAFLDFFSSAAFMPHGHCYLWRSDVLWLNVLSDALIAVAYFSIPAALVTFVRKRSDLRFNWIFWMFAAFILLCGSTHIVEIWTTWNPVYGAQGVLKLLTGLVSITTAALLWPLLPKALALPSAAQLRKANDALKELTATLEDRVSVTTEAAARADAEVRAGDRRYRALLDLSPQFVWTANASGALTYCNQHWYDYTGLPATDGLGEDWFTVMHEDDRASVLALWQRALASGAPYQAETRFRRADGSYRWHSIKGQPAEVGTDGRAGWIAVGVEIHERKEAERAIRESEAQFRDLANCLPQLCWMTDKTGWIFWYNQRWYDYTGTTFADMQGRGWQSVHHPEHAARIIGAFNQSLATGEPYEGTFPLRSKTGEWRWFLTRAQPIRDESGAIVRWFGSNTDITAVHEAELALRQSESKFRTITDAMPQMVWSTLPNGDHDYYNARWYEFTGMPPGATDGVNWSIVLHADDQERAKRIWHHCISTGAAYQIEYRLRHHSGQYRWALGRALPVRDDDGQIIRWMGTCTDIDDQKRAADLLEARVKERTVELSAANKELEAFGYSVSHDLRAPLRGIDGFSDVLLRRFGHTLNDEAKGYLARVKDAAGRMAILIDDMLKLSRLTRREVDRVPLDMTAMAEAVVAALREREPERHVTVAIAAGMTAVADSVLLHTVLENLLGNAWKFTRKTSDARIECRAFFDGGETVFYVRDNGAGFNMEYRDKLFGAFQRLHGTDEFEGTGIGLASVFRALRRHGGRVWAEGCVDQGATFYFTVGNSQERSN